jgi:hypothetical protein
MLQARDGGKWRARAWARGLTAGLLAAAVLGASALRGAGPRAPGSAPPAAAVGARAKEVAPFDLSFVPPTATVAFAIRPHAFFEGPGLKKRAALVDEALKELNGSLELPAPLLPPVASIEQVVVSLQFHSVNTDKEGKGKQTALLASRAMIRTTADFDWHKHLRAALPEMREARHAGKVYYRAPKVAYLPLFPNFSYHMVNRRTVVLGDEAGLREWLQKGRGARPRSWAADWKQVERGLVAVALDGRDRRWLDERPRPDTGMTADQVAAARHIDSLVAGLDAAPGGLTAQALGQARTARDAAVLARAGQIVLAELAKSFGPAGERKGSRPEVLERAARDILSGLRAQQDGTAVRCRGETKVSLTELVTTLIRRREER